MTRTRTVAVILALLLACLPTVSPAQSRIERAPGVNGAGLSKGTLTIPSGSMIQINMSTPTITSATKDDGSGSLAAGAYKITVVGVDPAGGVTLYPTALTATCAGGASHIDVVYVAPVGAVSTRVYVTLPGGATPDRYFTSTSATAYAFTTVAGATVAALPSTANAYRDQLGGSLAHLVTPIASSDPIIWKIGGPSGVLQAMRVDAALSNTALGYLALRNTTTAHHNTAVGVEALAAVTVDGGSSLGNYNSAFGSVALAANTSGWSNAAFGGSAMAVNTTGVENSAFGDGALQASIDGDYNVGLGVNALYGLEHGSNNTAVGTAAGQSGTAGSGNIFLGYKAGNYETGSNTLIVDNNGGTDEATGRARALLYGSMNATVASQTLVANAAFSSSVSLGVDAGTKPIGWGANLSLYAPAAKFLAFGGTTTDFTSLGYSNLAALMVKSGAQNDTYNDATSSGVVSARYIFGLPGAPTLTATTATTYTTAATVYIAGAPTAGANVDITTARSLWVAGGTSYFGGNVIGEGTIGTTGGIYLGAANSVEFYGRSALRSASDGALNFTNNNNNGFTTLNLGPVTGNSASGSSSITHTTTVINMATASGTGTGTITSANTALPVGLTLGVTCRVSPALAGASLTTFSLGDGTDVDRFGTTLAIDLNTLVNVANYTSTAPLYKTATGALVLTAAAGVFSTGILTCTSTTMTFTPIGS